MPPASSTRSAFNRQLWRAMFVPVVLLLLCPAAGYLVIRHVADIVRWDRHSLEVLAAAHKLENACVDLETGVRGFRITGDALFLEPYDAALKTVGSQFEILQGLVADNPAQLHRLEVIGRDIEGWQAFATVAITRTRQQLAADTPLHLAGKKLMDHLRADMGTFIAEEQRLLKARSETVEPAKQAAVLRILGIFSLMTVAILWWTWKQMKLLAASYELALATMELEKERFRVTLASIGDAVIVADRNGTVTFLNSEAERMTGWSLKEARDHPLRTVFRIINEETRGPVDDPVEKVFREQRWWGSRTTRC